MTSFSHSSSPVARGTRTNGEPRPVGVFFKAASARKLVGWFAGPAEIADVVLIMRANFKIEDAPRESRTLFSHSEADARFGASVFWLRDGMLPDEMMQMLLETWQTKRDGTKRGIVEIK